MRAVVICGGVGKRLRPLTNDVPKPLVKVKGDSLLTHILRGLRPYVDGYVLVVGYLREKITSFYGDSFEGVPITYVVQEEAKGTAHALLCAEPLIKEKFVLVYGDLYFNSLIYKKVFAQKSDGVIVAKTVLNPEQHGVLELDKMGFVSGILEKVPNPPSNLVNAGIYLLPVEVFSVCKEIKLSQRGEYELTDAFKLLAIKGFKIKPVIITEWNDVGTLERLKEAEEMKFTE